LMILLSKEDVFIVTEHRLMKTPQASSRSRQFASKVVNHLSKLLLVFMPEASISFILKLILLHPQFRDLSTVQKFMGTRQCPLPIPQFAVGFFILTDLTGLVFGKKQLPSIGNVDIISISNF
jgi:hypothetical protein